MDAEFWIQLLIILVATTGATACATTIWDHLHRHERWEKKVADAAKRIENKKEQKELLERCDWQNELFNHIGSIEYIKRLEAGTLERVYYTSGKVKAIEAGWKELTPVVWDDDFYL
ncbi:hypothetical protein PBI_ASERPROCKY_75 [Gordonia phage ASerpRocky]|nr:hypothetical protein PBI_ASERPROCKY_75 [Gordonia phage ASerpRocky]